MQAFVDDLTRQIREQRHFTAVSIAVVHREHPVVSSVSGVRRHKSSLRVKREDKWHIGSITKSITASVVGKLVDEELLQFDTALPDLLPDMDMHFAWSDRTLVHLLTNTAGVPANFPWKAQKVDSTSEGELVHSRHALIREALSKSPMTARTRFGLHC